MKPKVILLGTKPASVLVLNKMLEAQWDIKAIVVPTDYDQSWMPKPTLREYAENKGIKVFHKQEDVNVQDVDYVISYMYRNLVKQNIIELAKYAAINFHPAPLPRFAGFAFYNVAILEGVEVYGCTCHHMDSFFDTGNIVKVRTFEINPNMETAASLERKTQIEMLRLFDEFIKMAESGLTLPSIHQDKATHRYMNREEFELLKEINNSAKPEEVQRVARAFWYPPYECAYFKREDGSKVQIVPNIALKELGHLMHLDDFTALGR